MLEQLKQEVCLANVELSKRKLAPYTWGNVSGLDFESRLIVIKPSGIPYERLKPEDMVVLSLSGEQVEGNLCPSSDTKTHLEIYRAFPQIGGIVHTHSTFAVAWAQAVMEIPCFGTTHADYFQGTIPCTRYLTKEEVNQDYEQVTGKIIVETLCSKCIDPFAVPGVICAGHGPFTWGKSAAEAVYHAVVLEHVAQMATYTHIINPAAVALPQHICDKHYDRKHGVNAYYGQNKSIQ